MKSTFYFLKINERIPVSTMKDHYRLHNTHYKKPPQVEPDEEKEFRTHVKFNTRGVQNHILIGHGVEDNNVCEFFNKRIQQFNQFFS